MANQQVFQAVTHGDVNFLTALLTKQIDLHKAKNKAKQTPLHVAAFLGDVRIVQILLQESFEASLSCQDEAFGHTPLHTACFFNQTKVVKYIVEHTERKKITQFLAKVDRFGWTCLHYVARNGNHELCDQLLNAGADPKATNCLGRLPVHYAAEKDHTQTVALLMSYMGFPFIQDPPVDKNGMNVLHCAAQGNSLSVFEYLKSTSFPSLHKCNITKDQSDEGENKMTADELAKSLGHKALANQMEQYSQVYEKWKGDICEMDTFDLVKVCIIGAPQVGKSCLRRSLKRGMLGAAFESDREESQPSAGIIIESTAIGPNTYTIWDFAGQLENYITHQLFLTTDSTIYLAVVNLMNPLEETRKEIMRWLKLIKVRNIGLLQYSNDPFVNKLDLVNLAQSSITEDPILATPKPIRRNHSPENSPESEKKNVKGGRNWKQKVPVIIVGSHLDELQKTKSEEEVTVVLDAVNRMVNELQLTFWPFLKVSPSLVALNCKRAKTEEMAKLKEDLEKIRHIKVQHPRVVRTVSERLRESHNSKNIDCKIVTWDEICKLVRGVNQLLSDNQITFLMNILHNIGDVVYINEGVLKNSVFLDPAWLCTEVLGPALAPKEFKEAKLTKLGEIEISQDNLMSTLESLDKKHVDLVIQLLLNLYLCWQNKDTQSYTFPGFIEDKFDSKAHWELTPNSKTFSIFIGRSFACGGQMDVLAPGFVARLAVFMKSSLKIDVWKDTFIASDDADKAQALVHLNPMGTVVEVRVRGIEGSAEQCMRLMEKVQWSISRLMRFSCPHLFLRTGVLSTSDIFHNRWPAHAYHIQDVLTAKDKDDLLTHPRTKEVESPMDLLYCGSADCAKVRTGRLTQIAYLKESLVQRVDELLASEDKDDNTKDWKDLALVRGFGDYVQMLECREPRPVKYLLRKWGESHKYTAESLIHALEEIQRHDASLFVNSQFMK